MKIIIFVYIIFIVAAISCAKKSDNNAKIKIRFDQSAKDHLNSLATRKDFSLADPAGPSDLKCFGVFVDYPEQNRGNYCTVSATPGRIQRSVTPDEVAGLVPISGGELTMNVLAGPNRKLQVIAFDTDFSTIGKPVDFCPNVLTDFGPFESVMSKPFVIAELGVNISPGEQDIAISAEYIDGVSTKLDDCQGPFFQSTESTFNICDPGGNLCAYHFDASQKVYEASCGGSLSTDGMQAACWGAVYPPTLTVTQSAMLPTFSASVTSSLPMINFDYTSAFYSATTGLLQTIGTDSTIVVVFRTILAPNAGTMIGNYSSPNGFRLGFDATGHLQANYAASTTLSSTATIANNEPGIALFTYHTVHGVHLCLNSSADCVTTTASGSLPVGDLYFSGNNNLGVMNEKTRHYLGEILIYNRYMDENERSDIFNHLKNKWGL